MPQSKMRPLERQRGLTKKVLAENEVGVGGGSDLLLCLEETNKVKRGTKENEMQTTTHSSLLDELNT